MRLTLRTLLAHLDGVQVETGDSSELAKKVEESEFVRNLVQRIRTSMARPRLAAAKIDGQGLGHDPNTVAAYLDNTLPQDRMPDLEKICLESDVMLAEVAACHQILSLVLQQPAKVPPRLRDRVYRIGNLGTLVAAEAAPPIPEPPPPPVVAAAPQPPVPVEEKPEPRKREIPEYLRETRSLGWKPLVLTVVLGFLLAALLLRMVGPFGPNHPILGFLAGDRPPVENGEVAQADNTAPPEPEKTTGSTATDATEGQKTTAPQPAPSGDETPTPSETPTAEPPTSEKVNEPPATAAAAAGAASATIPSADSAPGAAATEPPEPPPVVATPSSAAPPEGTEPPPTTIAGAASPTTEDPIPSAVVKGAPPEEATDPAPAAPAGLGRFISETEVLARFHPENNEWRRVPTNAPLMTGEQLLAFPAYRPQVVLASNVQMTLAGGTLVELRPPTADGMANIALEYGRLVVVPVGMAEGGVHLDLWGRQGAISFSSSTSLMAIQVRRYRSPGVDPEAGLAHRMVEIHAVGGGLVWREPGRPDQPIQAGETFGFLDDVRGAVAPTEQLPPWVEANDIDRVDEMAAQEVQTLLPLDRPLSLTLLELAEHRKSEVVALAVRSLMYLDLFEPFVDALNNDLQKSYWDDHFNEAQRALARSPQSAREVRIAFEKVRGPDGPALYRMLWSYGPEELAGGDAERLVNYLSHPSLDFRVLAIQNLDRITGGSNSFLYRPEVTEARRKTPIARWREALSEGKVQYATKVLMLPPRIPPGADAAPEEPAPLEPESVE
jgi:hypothetical protein